MTKQTTVLHSVKAAAIGALFRKPDVYQVEISVERRRSRWSVRSDCNGFSTYRNGFPTKRAATEAASQVAAETTRLNEEARASHLKATA